MNPDAPWRLRFDICSGRVLLWVAGAQFAWRYEATRDVHRYFADRYSRLAQYHYRRNHAFRAQRLAAKASWHLDLAGGPDLPPALSMAMAVPRPRNTAWAVAASAGHVPPDDAA